MLAHISAVNMAVLTVSQMKALKVGQQKDEKKSAQPDQVVMPTFLPSRMKKGEGVFEVATRQRFVTEGITVWLEWHFYRALAIAIAIATLVLLSINIWLAAGAGIAAGHFYSVHVRRATEIRRRWLTRRLLYTR